MKKRVVALILAIVTLFTAFAVPAGAVGNNSKKAVDLTNIWTDGYPMFDIGALVETFIQFNKDMNAITGMKIFEEDAMVIIVDETLTTIVESIIATVGVDFSKIYNNLPAVNTSAELVTSALNLNIPEAQAFLKDIANKLRNDGNTVAALAIDATAIWLGIVDEVKLMATPVNGKPYLNELGIIVTYRDGRTETFYSGIFYDSKTNEFVGKDGEPALLGYSMDLNQNMVYTGLNTWQREMGFNIFYDIFCYLTPFFFHYTTLRFPFNYGGKDWQIQMWKGRYAIANGGEVGIYTRDESKSGSFYDCGSDEDMLVMSLDVYHGDELLFHRDPTLHWWITGFHVNDTAYLPESLTLVTTITMRDNDMLKAFTDALKKKDLFLDYEVNGLNVTITW